MGGWPSSLVFKPGFEISRSEKTVVQIGIEFSGQKGGSIDLIPGVLGAYRIVQDLALDFNIMI